LIHFATLGNGSKAKVFGFSLCALLFALCSVALAQQAKKIPRIGYVSGTGDVRNPGPHIEAFQQGLRDLGYIEGKNILVEYRYAEGRSERFASLVTELVQLKVDLMVIIALPAVRAAMQATKTIPIVMVTQADPVAAGLIDSLARPGGNITGLTQLTRDLSGKRLELFKEVVPTISRIGILLVTGSTTDERSLKEYEPAARALKVQLQTLEVRSPAPDLEGALRAAANARADALLTMRHPLLTRNTKRIADLAIKKRLPSMFESVDYVEAGGLVSYASNESDNFRRAAVYVDKILKGAKPAELPVEQPTKFEFVVNLKTAKQIGLVIPPNVLARADRVIK
jgi:ABC-type uncharacterized transport system substrate-binding protein